MGISAELAAALTSNGGAALAKLERESGASVRVDTRGTTATVSGSEAEVSRAEVLLERKAGAVSFAARAAQPVADLRAYQPASGSAAPDYSFKGVAGFVADADAAREALKGAGAGAGAGAALAALAAYDDDDDDGGGGE